MMRFFSALSLVLAVILPLSAAASEDTICADCHGDVVAKWKVSHHAKAMQTASEQSVLGDFSGVSITHHSQTATFSRSGAQFQVTMKDGGDQAQTYTVIYTFGFTPLQQYLVKTGEGRFQVLPFAWDSRKNSDGGQRWFHIFPEEFLPAGDRLHWQQPLQNWNGMCADCHSTGLKRNYDADKNIFKTQFDSVNVSCSSCHAGANQHARARNTPGASDPWKDKLSHALNDGGAFAIEADRNTAFWIGKHPRKRPELEVCAACHSRRAPLNDGINPALDFLDQFSPSLLDEGLYYADGQIQDEVYVWGSFQQSKMFKAGVSCLDCHDSHSLKLKVEGNGLCTQCHAAEAFDVLTHHHHKWGQQGAKCVSCHMPETTYMGVDPRRDHSFKIPRPDLSDEIGSPNACVTCHEEQTNSWAAQTIRNWFPASKSKGDHAILMHRARQSFPTTRRGVIRVIQDEDLPAIKRATALSLVPRLADAELIRVAQAALKDSEPLVRIGAVRAMAVLPPTERLTYLKPLLDDKVKAVRVEAARQLLDATDGKVMEQAFQELERANLQAAWRGEGRMNLALPHELIGHRAEAEKQYNMALMVDPDFAPATINLSELMRRDGREQESFALLKRASEKVGTVDPAIFHSYGLALVRRGEPQKGLAALQKAMKGAENNPRYRYVYLVALNSLGKADAAYRGLKEAVKEFTYDVNILNFALSMALQRQEASFARQTLNRLLQIQPDNTEYQNVNQQLRR